MKLINSVLSTIFMTLLLVLLFPVDLVLGTFSKCELHIGVESPMVYLHHSSGEDALLCRRNMTDIAHQLSNLEIE